MRIGLISYHTSPLAALGSSSAGGMNVYVRRLAEGLAERDVLVDVFTRRDCLDAPPELEFAPGARLVTVRAGPPARTPKHRLPLHASAFASALARFCIKQDLRYDLIHSHYWLSALSVEALRSSHQPVVHMFHTLSRIKRLYQPEAARTDAASRDYAELRLLRSNDTLVFATEAEIDDVEKVYGHRPRSVAVIPPGVDRDRFAPRDRSVSRRILGLGAECVVLCVGRMDRAKGVDALLRIVPALVNTCSRTGLRVLVVGGDDGHRDSVAHKELTRLQGIVRDLGIGAVVDFRGVVPHEDLPHYYSACDVCVVPSRYESFGIVAVEALASGRPVVGFRSRGLEQTVRDGRTGLLAPPGDIEALTAAVARILADPALACRMSIAAADSVKQFSWSRAVDDTVDLYQDLIAGNHLSRMTS